MTQQWSQRFCWGREEGVSASQPAEGGAEEWGVATDLFTCSLVLEEHGHLHWSDWEGRYCSVVVTTSTLAVLVLASPPLVVFEVTVICLGHLFVSLEKPCMVLPDNVQ